MTDLTAGQAAGQVADPSVDLADPVCSVPAASGTRPVSDRNDYT